MEYQYSVVKQSIDMLGAVWLCVLALALPCWTFPSGHITTCEEFGRGVSFDPVNAVGEWFTVYCFGDNHDNETEKTTIRELTPSQLEQYDHLLRGYSKNKLKLEIKTRIAYPVVKEADLVLVPQDNAGNVDFWITHFQEGSTVPIIPYHGPQRLKWKIVDGFLVMRWCSLKDVCVLSKTITPNEDKLQRAVDSLHIEGVTGHRIYPLTLL